MKAQDLRLFILAVALSVISFACSSDDPEPVDPPELITTLMVTFSNNAMTGDVVTAIFRDLDGPGGNDPELTNPTLSANSSYTVTLAFLNEQENPAEDITAEVREEDEEHQVFFFRGQGLNIVQTYDDTDANGFPLGLTSTLTTAAASSGTYTVVLVHEPIKDAAGVSEGNLNNAGGEEDIRVAFTMTIE